eukprot:gene13704-16153_t
MSEPNQAYFEDLARSYRSGLSKETIMRTLVKLFGANADEKFAYIERIDVTKLRQKQPGEFDLSAILSQVMSIQNIQGVEQQRAQLNRSFHSLDRWKQEFIDTAHIVDMDSFPFVLVGLKSEMTSQRLITEHMALEWCQENGGMPYFEVSPKLGTNVERLFHSVSRLAIAKVKVDEQRLLDQSAPKVVQRLKDNQLVAANNGLEYQDKYFEHKLYRHRVSTNLNLSMAFKRIYTETS